MKNKEKAKNYNALYRKQHFIAIAIKHRMYKKLPRIKEREKQNQRRKDYFKRYCQGHKEYFRRKHTEWVKQNPEKRKLILKRYSEKLRQRRSRLNHKSRLKRIIDEFLDYCQDRYDKVTIRHYTTNMERFYNYIETHSTLSRKYQRRYSQEQKKPEHERDSSWTEEYKRLRYAEDIDKDFLARYVSFINHDAISPKTKLSLSQSEKESRLAPLKTFLKYCQRKGFINKDLTKFIIVPPREKKVLKRVMSQDEMERFLEVPNVNKTIGIRDRTLLELSYSGFRAEEMLSLKLGEVDLITNAVTILNAKGDKDRVIPMTSEAIYWIKRWLNRRCEFMRKDKNTEYLFTTKQTKPITRRHLAKLIKRYAKKADIPIHIAPHDLRRTTATHLVENGAPIRLVQALLGHATLKATTEYLRLSDEKIKKEHKKSHPCHRRHFHYADIRK